MQAPSPAVAGVFEPVQTATTLEDTVERLGTAIRLGLPAAGERLPPERDLADQLGISRSTLRQALTSLTESAHLVAHRGRGGGTFVAEAPPMARSNEQHAALVAALARRDAWGAARLVREHLKGTEQVLAGLKP